MTIIIPIATLCVGLVAGFCYCDHLTKPIISGWKGLYRDSNRRVMQLQREIRDLAKRHSGDDWKDN